MSERGRWGGFRLVVVVLLRFLFFVWIGLVLIVCVGPCSRPVVVPLSFFVWMLGLVVDFVVVCCSFFRVVR